ncbi:MAG: class I SAM-dependent methyltransferase [Proteobacteria bacterium]|nr:class I SAM-dependent methyltransferase [Pseudomonadota bacterium]
MNPKEHWEQVYRHKLPDEVSWFQKHADLSVHMIRHTGLGEDAAILDVGGGTSVLADDLLALNYTNLTVLDLSSHAIKAARLRMGEQASKIHWIEADITQVAFPAHQFDIWHDRAVFHFLTHPADRQRYIGQVMHALRPGGYVIMATFAEDGPEQCSGLPVMRYQPESLHTEFGFSFELIGHQRETHHTPLGQIQQFIYCYCKKTSL